jgi:D-alanine-D-alanine ligase
MSGDSSAVIIPASLPADVIEKIRNYAVKAFKALDCSGLARVDFFVRKDTGEVFINEINTMPGFTQISMYAKLWAASGVPYGKLIDRLIELALERYEDNKRDLNE